MSGGLGVLGILGALTAGGRPQRRHSLRGLYMNTWRNHSDMGYQALRVEELDTGICRLLSL